MSEIVWETAGSEEIIVGTSADGEYGGKVVESTYAFTPQRSDNGVEVSCTPKWKEDLLTALKKTVTLNILCEYGKLLKVFNVNNLPMSCHFMLARDKG